jgi:hypothetical protein
VFGRDNCAFMRRCDRTVADGVSGASAAIVWGGRFSLRPPLSELLRVGSTVSGTTKAVFFVEPEASFHHPAWPNHAKLSFPIADVTVTLDPSC